MLGLSKKQHIPVAASKQSFIHHLRRDRYLLLMFLPIFIYYIIFSYIPMAGIIIAFKDFKPGMGLFGGEWVGLQWVQQFFSSPFAYRLIRNTVLLSLYSLIFGFPIPIFFAVCVTEIQNSKIRRSIQTVSYMPHFVSTVVLVGIINNLFTTDNSGIVNQIISRLGGTPIRFLLDPSWFRRLYVGSGIWQNFGFNSIIYIAAIGGIDPGLYEAAKIDGITRFKQIFYITLPLILPTIIILFILQVGNIMSVGFEKVFLMSSPSNMQTADVISTYVYRQGIQSSNYSFATAVGLFNSIINFLFVFISNMISRRTTDTGLW